METVVDMEATSFDQPGRDLDRGLKTHPCEHTRWRSVTKRPTRDRTRFRLASSLGTLARVRKLPATRTSFGHPRPKTRSVSSHVDRPVNLCSEVLPEWKRLVG